MDNILSKLFSPHAAGLEPPRLLAASHPIIRTCIICGAMGPDVLITFDPDGFCTPGDPPYITDAHLECWLNLPVAPDHMSA